ncbi:MAG: hypothetical protein PHV34_01845 [Verrucomicrobiae bacterium]|nr:hypothetical protein [Verrucomicrobiae bacterium]
MRPLLLMSLVAVILERWLFVWRLKRERQPEGGGGCFEKGGDG